jgi:hypothetical protein
MSYLRCFIFGVLLLIRPAAAQSILEQIEFFENKIRPVFAERCYSCHSEKAEKLKGGLRLDTAEGVLKGGTSGPVIVAGEPDASLLIKAVRYADPDLQMPPKGKRLSAEKIANLEAWVKMGAPMPHISVSSHRPLTEVSEARARHWAFQPVKKPGIPAVKLSRWVQTPVDRFVLAKLEEQNLKPAPAADRRTLIRRVTYDLIGLPPTYDEVEGFVHDKRPDAYSHLVNRLLASPHYGERWGRYWLDVARFADTKGYLAGGEERRYAFSYTYRDYVIRAFNEDKPYDRFLIEQIAADLVLGPSAAFSDKQLSGIEAGGPGDRRSLAALGFLTLGRRFLNNQNDIIDDRIDVVTRGTLGLTVACARCHDHKFDPIPTKDYYALHGIFASSEEPGELPLLAPLRDTPDYEDYLKAKAKIEGEIPEFKDKEVAKFIGELRQHVGDYLLGARDAARLAEPSKFETFAGERKLDPVVLKRWMKELESRNKKDDAIFGPWFALEKFSEADFTNAVSLLEKIADEPKAVNPVVVKVLIERKPGSLKEAAETYTKLFKGVDEEWKSELDAATKEKKPAPGGLPEKGREELRQVLYAEGMPVNVPRAEAETILARKLGEGTAPFRNRIQALSWTHPGAPLRAMALADRPSPANSHVFLRGNPGTPGEEVPRRFLSILSPPERCSTFTNGSGRLDLAKAIASSDNPLTARVYVNRVWLHHFGEGLVSTPGDFGVRTEEPVQRGLLDYLAASFIENGWSTKYLHRLIVLSATYQQSSDAPEVSLKADPENRLLSRMNRQRLDFEAMRDTLLSASGKIDLKVGGLPVDLESEPFSARRTIYGLIDRQNLPTVLRTFDFANPDTSNQRRFHTTVPQQALFLMNSPFVIEQTREMTERAEVKSARTSEEKIEALYRVIFQREPMRGEVRLGEEFLNDKPSSQMGTNSLSAFEKYGQALLLSNELSFVD